MFNPYHHTVPLFRYNAPFPWLDGTGVFVAVDEHRFVFTAAHVVEENSKRIAFGYQIPESDKVELFGDDEIPMISADAIANKGTRRAIYKEGMDLAVFVLPRPISNWLETRYLPYDLRANKPRDGVAIVSICGWPESKNRYNVRKRRFEDGFGCRHIQTQAVLKNHVATIGGDPSVHFAVRMDKRRDFIDMHSRKPIPQLFSLTGVSGSGVWDLDHTRNEMFPSNATALAGIITEDHPTKNLAKVIRIQQVWSPLVKMLGIQP